MLLTTADADEALRLMLHATLVQESILAARDAEIAAIQTRHSATLAQAQGTIAETGQALETYYRAMAVSDGRQSKSLQFAHGLIGMRAPSNPALVPLHGFTWDKAAKKLKSLFKTRFFHKPKPPAPDKVKIKRELTVEQLAKCGLALDNTESFYVELNRLAVAKYKEAA